jgi:hypothetical protein
MGERLAKKAFLLRENCVGENANPWFRLQNRNRFLFGSWTILEALIRKIKKIESLFGFQMTLAGDRGVPYTSPDGLKDFLILRESRIR